MDRLEDIKEYWKHGSERGDVDWLISEIERLRQLIESAYKEGHFDASEDISLAVGWYQSTVQRVLKEENNMLTQGNNSIETIR